ncbi:MAG: methyltransferase domain-containing protein [Planctomycetota bacterium]
MTRPASDNSFSHDVAKFYESTLVPLIFEPYAADLAARAKALEPRSVLEVACGTGVVTRALAAALPAECAIIATDLSGVMVAYGESLGTERPVTWGQADVNALPYAAGSFDVVVCQLAAMLFQDRPDAYREVRRVLRPGGTFLFSLWREIEENEFARVVTEAMGDLYPENPPDFLARTAYGHGSRAEIEADVDAAGFRKWTLTRRDDISRAANPGLPAIAYCQGTPLRREIEAREPGGIGRATEVAAQALRTRFGDGPIAGRISAIVVAAG